MSSPSRAASFARGATPVAPALPELKKAFVPAAATQPPVEAAQQPRARTPRGGRPDPQRGKARPALWQNLRAAPRPAVVKPADPAEEARAAAEAIMGEARADAERLKDRVERRARTDGQVRGRAQARVELRRMMRQARAVLREVHALRAEVLNQLGDEVVETAVALAMAVIGRRAGEDGEDLRALAGQLLAEARGPRGLRANPADVPALEGLGVPVESDPGLSRGGFVLQAADGERDARLEARIARLEAALKAGEAR